MTPSHGGFKRQAGQRQSSRHRPVDRQPTCGIVPIGSVRLPLTLSESVPVLSPSHPPSPMTTTRMMTMLHTSAGRASTTHGQCRPLPSPTSLRELSLRSRLQYIDGHYYYLPGIIIHTYKSTGIGLQCTGPHGPPPRAPSLVRRGSSIVGAAASAGDHEAPACCHLIGLSK